MANRYWVGGTANWDGTAGTKWALTSGGTGGETVPTTADDVFFDGNSTGTVTIATGNTGAKSITCTGFTGTLAGTDNITVAGNITLVAGMTYSHTGTVTITATSTLTTAGKTFSGINLNASGGTLTLGDALSTGNRTIQITAGTFTTNNNTVSTGAFNSSNSNVRTINLGSSTVTLSQSDAIAFTTSTNLTFNAGTSSITLSNANATLDAGSGFTFYNVTFNAGVGNCFINGANTFNNLTFNGPGTAGVKTYVFNANQTINGTFTATGSSGNQRIFVSSDRVGTARTITAATVSLTDVDFQDITAAGVASPFTGTRLGNAAGNTNITFDATKTVYWSLLAGGNFTSNAFATSSNGTPATTNFPLAQDTLIIDDAGLTTGNTITVSASYNYSTITVTRTNAFTFSMASTLSSYGDITLTSATTTSGAGSLIFLGRKTQTLNAAGKSFASVAIEAPNTTVSLAGDLTISNTQFTLNGFTSNTLTTNNYNITTPAIVSNQGTFNLGSSTITCTGTGSIWNITGGANSTINAGTSTIIFSNTSTNFKTFAGNGKTYYNLVLGAGAGTCTYTISGSNTFNSLSSNKSVAYTVSLTSGTTQTVTTWGVNGSSGNTLTLQRSSTTNATIAKAGGGTATIDYATVTGITGSPVSTWYAINSTDGGNNVNITFGFPSINVNITETQTLSESISPTLTYVVSSSETQTLSDSNVSESIYEVSASEAQTLSDTQLTGFSVEIIENQILAENIFTTANHIVSITETQTLNDVINRVAIFNVASSESQTFNHTQSISFVLSGAIAEFLLVNDAINSTASMSTIVYEPQIFTDKYNTVGWYVIPTSDNTWNNIPTTSNIWTNINP